MLSVFFEWTIKYIICCHLLDTLYILYKYVINTLYIRYKFIFIIFEQLIYIVVIMAKQKGVINLVGTIGGINFYVRKGVAVARKAGGGFTAKSIKNSPKMVRVRENSSEFGRCSQLKRVIKESLYVLLKDYKDASLHARMMRLMQEIKVLDSISERGQRKVEQGLTTSLGKQLFLNFPFTENYRLSNLLNVSITVNPINFSCIITGFDLKSVVFPKGATHLKLSYLVCTYDFDVFSFKNYETSLFFEAHSVSSSSLIFSPDLPLENLANVMCFCGISFYQQVGNEKYVLKNTNAVGVQCVHISL